jgi:hypothetical protein
VTQDVGKLLPSPTMMAAGTFAWLLCVISRRQIEPFDPAYPLRNRQVAM